MTLRHMGMNELSYSHPLSNIGEIIATHKICSHQYKQKFTTQEIFALNPSYATEKRPSGRTPP